MVTVLVRLECILFLHVGLTLFPTTSELLCYARHSMVSISSNMLLQYPVHLLSPWLTILLPLSTSPLIHLIHEGELAYVESYMRVENVIAMLLSPLPPLPRSPSPPQSFLDFLVSFLLFYLYCSSLHF